MCTWQKAALGGQLDAECYCRVGLGGALWRAPVFTALCKLRCLQARTFRAGVYPGSIPPRGCLIQTATYAPMANCKGQASPSLVPCPAQETCQDLGTACYSCHPAMVLPAPTPLPWLLPTSATCSARLLQASMPLPMLFPYLECSLSLPFFLLQTPIFALKCSLHVTSSKKSSLTSLPAWVPPSLSYGFLNLLYQITYHLIVVIVD